MFRRTLFGLLATLAASASVFAQEPVYGLLSHESGQSPGVVPANEQAAAYAPIGAELASFSGGGITHGGYADGAYVDGGYAAGGHLGGDYFGGCQSCGSCGGGCGGCGYCGQCSGCPTIWRLRSSSVYMSRETTDDTILAFQNVFSPAFAPLMNAADFSFEWETGFDISLMQGDGYGGEVEGRVLYLNDFDDRQVAIGDSVQLMDRIFFLGGAGAPFLNGRTDPVTVIADYHSEFRTVELNYREVFTPWWIVMIGFRYANLDEDLSIRTIDSAAVPLLSTTNYITDNDMFGFQMGTEMILASNPAGWDVITTLKGGVYYNRVDLRVNSYGDNFVNGEGSFVTGETAWLGEATIQARKHLTCNGTLTLGYSLLSVDGVALATEQMTTILNPLDGPVLQGSSNRGTVLYHGLNVGVELRW